MTENKKINKPPYLLGLLCLLPLIGAFVGIALILYGVFRYKDKWLIIIGLSGLLITIAAYSFLFYNMKYGKNASKDYAEIAQTKLNSLVKNIEFYKLQKGMYPDSLIQLTDKDEIIDIDDPFLMRKMDRNLNVTFQYQKIGKGYTLFSVGIDGTANTMDDIYPNIESNSVPFGLIKK